MDSGALCSHTHKSNAMRNTSTAVSAFIACHCAVSRSRSLPPPSFLCLTRQLPLLLLVTCCRCHWQTQPLLCLHYLSLSSLCQHISLAPVEGAVRSGGARWIHLWHPDLQPDDQCEARRWSRAALGEAAVRAKTLYFHPPSTAQLLFATVFRSHRERWWRCVVAASIRLRALPLPKVHVPFSSRFSAF